jgi:hypothetical protein
MHLIWGYCDGPITTLSTGNNEENIITREVDGQNIDLVILQDAYFVFYTEDFSTNRGRY